MILITVHSIFYTYIIKCFKISLSISHSDLLIHNQHQRKHHKLYFSSFQSDGVAQTRILAEQHAKEAVRMIQQLKKCSSQQALIHLVKFVLDRKK